MSLRRNLTTGEIRDISDEQIAAWIAAGNPKGAHYSTAWEPYTPPEPEPASLPTEVTKWQFWTVATEMFGARGITKAAIRAMLPQIITDPVALALAYVDFDDAQTVRRDNPLLPMLSGVYSVTEAELDALFAEAAGR